MDTKPKVLVVDDNKTNVYCVAEVLEDDYEIYEAYSGHNALQLLENESVDLILLDIQMPEMNGYELLRRIKAQATLREIPVVFLTAYSEESSIVQGFELGAVDYVTKPLRKEELRSRVSTHIHAKMLKNDLKQINSLLCKQIDEEVRHKTKIYQENLEKQKQLLVHQSKLASLGEMIGAITHQWRQPLSSLIMSIDFLQDDFDDGKIDREFIKEFIATNKKIALFMNHTIDDFTGFLNESSYKKEFKVCCSAIKDVLQMLGKIYEKQNVHVTMNEHVCFSIHGNANEFKQVILNLFNNARDAIVSQNRTDGKIECTFEKNRTNAIIRIKDNGGGIADDLLPNKIFESYITTKGDNGTGIGLYMSQMIIESHFGGKLWAHNVDDGAEFVIELPID